MTKLKYFRHIIKLLWICLFFYSSCANSQNLIVENFTDEQAKFLICLDSAKNGNIYWTGWSVRNVNSKLLNSRIGYQIPCGELWRSFESHANRAFPNVFSGCDITFDVRFYSYDSNNIQHIKKIENCSTFSSEYVQMKKMEFEQALAKEDENIRKFEEDKKYKSKSDSENFNAEKKLAKIDAVAKVLNFTVGCDDNGCTDKYWFAHNAKSCIYRQSILNSEEYTQIKLNEIDPNSIKFQYERIPNIFSPKSSSILVTSVYVNEGKLFTTVGQIDMDRLKRGWSLIYSKYCTGKRREF